MTAALVMAVKFYNDFPGVSAATDNRSGTFDWTNTQNTHTHTTTTTHTLTLTLTYTTHTS